MIHSFDDTKDVAIVEDPVTFSCDYFLMLAKAAIAKRGRFTVALSGGSTPKALYSMLKNFDKEIDWSKVYVFFSDERSVGPNDPDSNYHMAMMSGFAFLPVLKEHIFRMEAESSPSENAAKYEALIAKHVPDSSFDLILLGMGDDGHTASLFPGTKALDETSKLVVENQVPQKKTLRMTFTYALLRKAQHITFLATGKGRAQMVKTILSDKEGRYPAARVKSDQRKVLWILDDGSASLLSR